MDIPYKFTNKVPDQFARKATLVFLENTLDGYKSLQQDFAETEGNNPGGVDFTYTAFQYLNPSSEAHESFTYTDEVWVVAKQPKKSSSDEKETGYACSEMTRVYKGQYQIIYDEEDKLQVVPCKGKGKGSNGIEVMNGLLGVSNTSPMTIEWYAGNSCIGISKGIKQKDWAIFSLGRALYFMPVQTSSKLEPFPPDEVRGATCYVPPTMATQVSVEFRVVPVPDDSGLDTNDDSNAEMEAYNDRDAGSAADDDMSDEDRQYLFDPQMNKGDRKLCK